MCGENKHDNSSVRLDHLLTTMATATLLIHYNIVSSIFTRIAGLRTPASDSGSGLPFFLTSLNHTSQLSNIIIFLLQHESTSQFTSKSFHPGLPLSHGSRIYRVAQKNNTESMSNIQNKLNTCISSNCKSL